MSLPKFFSRVGDSINPLLAASGDARELLGGKVVRLEAPDDLDLHPHHVAGFHLLVNLCARLYSGIQIVAGSRVVEECRTLALSINPQCEISNKGDAVAAVGAVAWACSPSSAGVIVVAPSGWEVLVDLPDAERISSTNMLVSLACACIAAAQLFRAVFATNLVSGRSGSEPSRFNVLSNGPAGVELPNMPSDINIGVVHLVGAGAVGQAAAYALARVSAVGTLVVVDPEVITLSNLQRYVLTTDKDVGVSKVSLVEAALARTNQLETVRVEATWDSYRGRHSAEAVCVAVDTERVRIEVQASLPRVIFNAWTQPKDLGWSRHESFGEHACLACLYWPTGTRPSDHENVSRAIRQHELRVLAYLSSRVPVGSPLASSQIPRLADIPVPPESAMWTRRSILDDIGDTLGLSESDLSMWKGKYLSDLYRDGICGGAIVSAVSAELPAEMAVPLAHQSALAGILLATQLLVAASPQLRPFRSKSAENRLDLLNSFPQRTQRPRQRTPACLCGDADFVEAYREKWGGS